MYNPKDIRSDSAGKQNRKRGGKRENEKGEEERKRGEGKERGPTHVTRVAYLRIY